MSTKIYNAYRIDNMTMPEIMKSLQKLKKETSDRIVRFMKNNVNHSAILNEFKDFNGFNKMLKDVHQTNINSPFNWNSSVVLYFHENEIYIIFFGVDLPIHDIFNNNLVDYHYQDQADPWFDFDLEENTEEYKQAEIDWERRKKVWEEIIEDRYSFSESGLYFDLFGKDDIFFIAPKLWTYIDKNNKMNSFYEKIYESSKK